MIWGLKTNSWFECPHKIRLDVFMSAFAIDFAKAGVRVDGQGLGLQDRGKGYKIRIGIERLRLGLEYMNSN